jgi:hypothetical protein
MLEQIGELAVGAEREQQIGIGKVAAHDRDREEQPAPQPGLAIVRRNGREAGGGLAEERADQRMSDVIQRCAVEAGRHLSKWRRRSTITSTHACRQSCFGALDAAPAVSHPAAACLRSGGFP